MGRRSYWWSDERRALLIELWPAGVPTDEIQSRLEALEGWPLDSPRIAAEAGRLNLHRPAGYRAVVAKASAIGRQRGWTELVNDRMQPCGAPPLNDNDALNIELRNKDNPDVLFLLHQLLRIQAYKQDDVDIEPHKLADIEIRQKGHPDFEDIIAELRRRGALRR